MKTLHLTTTSVALALMLSACSSGRDGDGYSYIGREAGSQVVDSNLGVSTANNVAVQTGQLAGSMAANLTRKFAREAPARVNFAFNSARLDATAQSQLRQQAQWIKAHPQIVFRVYGHTDKVGSKGFNRRLGQRRANAVVNFLVRQGISRSKLQAVASFGETRPLVLTENANRQNRRTVTEVSGFSRRAKADDLDGKYAQNVYEKYISTTYVIVKGD